MRKQHGFTLIEIAIVLVIVGLLLGGVLKGQELITSARVRNLVTTLDGIKIAYLGFQDRFRVLPGDYEATAAAANIPGTPQTSGCVAGPTCQNGKIELAETNLAWHQLSRSGFITGSYDGTGAGAAPTPLNNPTNPFSGYLQLIHDDQYSGTTPPVVFNTKTGGSVPASILAEIDRKIDDGFPDKGSFRSSLTYDGATTTCTVAGPPIAYNVAADIKTCGGVQIH